MRDLLIGIVLAIITLIFLARLNKGKSYDYKTRIRVYCALYDKNEIFYVSTKRPEVVKYVDDLCKDYEYNYKKKDFKIAIRYMSKLKYSLIRQED